MKAAILRAVGEPLTVVDIPRPVPRAGEVLVKVRACGVCHTDLHVIKGEVAFPTPCVLGHEISGTLVGFGPGVTGLTVGGRVVSSFIMPCGTCYYCERGRDDLCETFFALNRLKGTLYDGQTRLFAPDGSPIWMYSMGGLAEYCVVPATDVFTLPATLPLEESAILGCAIFTAYGAARNGAVLQRGESVAVVATGGVGSNLIQIARALGASPIIAIDVRDDKLAATRDLGATHAINSRSEDVIGRVREITYGRGVDVAFEALGRPETFVQATSIVRDGGRAVMVGIAPTGVTASVEITRLVRRGIRIIGSYGARTRVDLPAVIALAEAGAIDASRSITRRYPLDQVAEAYAALNAGDIVGRAIVMMSDEC
jgi:S-(hydroxymethyl)glutathione dehydrogenase/alcohol dehydrogenase